MTPREPPAGSPRDFRSPNVVQIVLGSDDLPFTKHLYATVFGFAVAGERLVYSEHNGQVMGFGGWGGATILYMVGRQEMLQLEFWTHTRPPQRPLSPEWRPNDIGFNRIGIAVPDFDATVKALASLGIGTLTAPDQIDGLRRVCFRDPTVGMPVEILEDGPALPGHRDRYHDLKPAIVYVAASVTDLDSACGFFGDTVGLERVDVILHGEEHERLWGLPDARRRTATLRGGTTFVELIQYETPAGRHRPLDDVLYGQGFKTMGVGYRDPVETGGLFERVKHAGLSWTVSEPASFIGGNHVVGSVALRMKTLSVPHDLEQPFGFAPEPAKWWRPPEPASLAPA